ncbi:P-II family nitrogen regulator [Alkalibaculum sp. M08DMB]|uniref:P-II family nitrogen regulator n=1 Tax=Alkalibaculum sporogenes TaxID=2655001 RepID=A0A6A7KBX3_9FIRM|nr:P-II family nitrogen regulator [Alkalibaculum sporogenes]MPW27049.1 P-II family nitrogen regulator [Alkalibaculum sporogenes]
MKEIISIIRMNKMNETKEALSRAGYPAMLCKKVNGRGKKMINMDILEDLIEGKEISSPEVLETITEKGRLIAKRLLTIVAPDEDVKKIVNIIIEINQTNNMGDGKIFVSPIEDAIRVRTDETGELAI